MRLTIVFVVIVLHMAACAIDSETVQMEKDIGEFDSEIEAFEADPESASDNDMRALEEKVEEKAGKAYRKMASLSEKQKTLIINKHTTCNLAKMARAALAKRFAEAGGDETKLQKDKTFQGGIPEVAKLEAKCVALLRATDQSAAVSQIVSNMKMMFDMARKINVDDDRTPEDDEAEYELQAKLAKLKDQVMQLNPSSPEIRKAKKKLLKKLRKFTASTADETDEGEEEKVDGDASVGHEEL